MLKTLRGTAQFIERKNGWSRLGIALSLTMIAVAVVVLYHILRTIDPDELLDAIEATDWHTLIIAGLFVAAGYLTLTFYDLFALRTIGRLEVPYRVAALAGFTSYAVGHNVGASVFSGGAVRYHIYSSWGLSVVEVTKICFVAGLTFWLGNATVLGLGILHAPQAARALDQMPLWCNRVVALVLLAMLAAYVAWVWVKPRVIGRDGWQVTLPGRPADACANRYRYRRFGVLRRRHVHAGAGRAQSRLRDRRGDFRRRDVVGFRQPCARRPRRVRRRHDGRTLAIR